MVADLAGQLHVSPVIGPTQFLGNHVFHLKLVVGVSVSAVIADAVILPVEPVAFVLRLLVVLPVMVVVDPAYVAGPPFGLRSGASPWLGTPRRSAYCFGVAASAQWKVRRLIFPAFEALAYYTVPGCLPMPAAEEMVLVDYFLAVLLVAPVGGHLFQLNQGEAFSTVHKPGRVVPSTPGALTSICAGHFPVLVVPFAYRVFAELSESE